MNVKRISKGSIHRDPSCSPLGKTTDMKLAVPECESTPKQFVGAGVFEFNTAQRAQPVRFNSTDTNKYRAFHYIFPRTFFSANRCLLAICPI